MAHKFLSSTRGGAEPLVQFVCTRRVLVAILLGLFSISASAASFDCKKAKTSFEKRVCSNPELSRLDEELAAAYKMALSKTADIDGLKKTQRRWWAAFQQSSPAVSVLAAAYRNRIYYLQFETSGNLNAIARERAFAARAVSEKLNCRAEPTVVQRAPSEWPWLLGRNKIYLECLTGLLFANYWLRVSRDGRRPLPVSSRRNHCRWPVLTLIRLEL